jgi:hypothetical protein
MNFVSYVPYNEIIISESAQGIHLTSCPNMNTANRKA